MIKDYKVSVVRARCTPELKKRVLDFAERFGIEEADVVRMALDDYVERNKDAEQLKVFQPAIVRVVATTAKAQAVEAAVDVAKSRKRAANLKP